jgi:hypothetical protein
MKRSPLILLSACLALVSATGAVAQTSPPALPQIRSADGKVILRAQPVQCVNDLGDQVTCGGSGGTGGGGGTSDATAANQQSQITAANLSNTRLGDIAAPATGSVNQRLGLIDTDINTLFKAGQSIGNTAFGISGTLPAFAAPPTVNLGTLNGAATAAGQAGQATAANQTLQATAANQVTQSGTLVGIQARTSPQETFQLASGNTATAAVTAFGGDYIFAQTCSGYGTLTLQVLGPNGTTYQPILTKTATDTTGGTGLALGSNATIQVSLSGTAGCSALLSRVP